MKISAVQTSIFQQDSQNHLFLEAMTIILLTIVEADDNKNQRSLVVFLHFSYKINKKSFYRLQLQTLFSTG